MAKSVANIALTLLLASALLAPGVEHAIPRNLDEAHKSLARHFSPADIERIRKMKSEDEMLDVVGLPQTSALTNEWQLWGNSPLARYFKRLGVAEPHDMVGIVAETYWCKLHSKPFALNERVAKLKAYYAREETMKPKGKCPRDGFAIDWFYSSGTLHLGVCASDGRFWRYDRPNGRGIEPARPEEARQMAEIVEASKHRKQ